MEEHRESTLGNGRAQGIIEVGKFSYVITLQSVSWIKANVRKEGPELPPFILDF